MPKVAIVGVGKVGGAIARSLSTSGFGDIALFGRTGGKHKDLQSSASVDADIIIICVPDSGISSIVEQLSSRISQNAFVFHTSGPLTSDLLAPLRSIGCSVASMHPLVSVADDELASDVFSGVYFGVEGDAAGTTAARSIVEALGGQAISVSPQSKPLYHAAAVAACGHVTAVIDLSIAMLKASGVSNDDDGVDRILLPLVKSTIKNIELRGTTRSLTGTFARADAAGLDRQLRAFDRKLSEEDARLYLDLASRSLRLALDNGVSREAVDEVQRMITLAKEKLR